MKTLLILLTLLNSTAIAREIQYTLNVDGITCPFCVASSKKDLSKIDGVKSVSANLGDGKIYVCADENLKFTDNEMKKLFLDKGLTYKNMIVSNECDK